jgi:extradiol dioxygenase family protein
MADEDAISCQCLGEAPYWIVAHLVQHKCKPASTSTVDGDTMPVTDFGGVLPMAEWPGLADKTVASGTRFIVEPQVRFRGLAGEQATLYVIDAAVTALAFKAFADLEPLIGKQQVAAKQRHQRERTALCRPAGPRRCGARGLPTIVSAVRASSPRRSDPARTRLTGTTTTP